MSAASAVPSDAGLVHVPLADLVEFRRGLTYRKADEVVHSSNVVLRANNVDLSSGRLDLTDIRFISDEIDIPQSKRLVPESLLICTASGSRSHLGKVGYVESETGYAFGGFMGLLVPNEQVSAKYLYYFLRSDAYQKFLANLSAGANINNLRFSDLGRLLVPVPTKVEQKRIVAILDQAFATLDRARAHAEANLADADTLQHGLVAGAIDDATADDNEAIKLGDLCKIARGGSPRPIKKFLTTSADGINWIKISDATASGKFIESTQEKITKDGVSRSRFVTSGSFLLTNSMSFGRPYILRTDGCIHDGWLVLEPDYSRVDQDYLYYLLGSRQVFNEFDRLAAGSTVRNLNIGLVSSVVVKLPPLHKQREAVKRIESAVELSTKLVDRYRDQLSDLEAFRQSMLQQAFCGQLT